MGGEMLEDLEYWNHNTVYYNWIKKQLKQSNRILDIGCGNGFLIRYLDDGTKFLMGIDSDKFCIEKFFPLSSNKATRNLEIGYRSPWLGGSCAFSSIPFKRWWVDSFKTLCANAPAQAELVGSFLTREIEVLAEKARKNNDKSGSVYKRFVERFEYLSLRVNQEFLDSTSYILHPELFFNIVSNNLVSLNEQEKRELMNKARRDSHFDDPLAYSGRS